MSGSTLLVPIHLDALVVAATSSDNDGVDFCWATPDYSQLDNLESPWNLSGGSSAQGVPGSDGSPSDALRVALHWALPDALTHAEPIDQGDLRFPPAPNRWLVARLGPGDATSFWIIESDYLDPNLGTTPYLDPSKPWSLGNTSDCMTLIGRAWTLADWMAQRAGGKPTQTFLTALGPAGNLAFAAFAPHCQNVFAFVDDTVAPNTQYTYVVVGWHDHLADDPLQRPRTLATGGKETFSDILARLRWSLPTGSASADRTLYSALRTSVDTGAPTSGDLVSPVGDVLSVVVGNTAIEALGKLIELEAQSNSQLHPQDAQAWTQSGAQLSSVLQALGYGRTDTLNKPDAAARLGMEVRDHWYGAETGGLVWEVVPSKASAPTLSEADTDALDAWLAALNQAQAQADAAQQNLESGQRELYHLWWSLQAQNLPGSGGNDPPNFGGGGPPDGGGPPAPAAPSAPQSQSGSGQGGDPGSSSSDLQSRYDEKLKEVWALAWSVARTTGLPPAQGLAAWADARCKLPSGLTLSSQDRELRSAARPRFHHPVDPVVLIKGLKRSQRHGEDGRSSADGTLACRLAAGLPAAPPNLLSGTPDGCPQLLTEAIGVQKGTVSPAVPAFAWAKWEQPSTPLFLQWSMRLETVPLEAWHFDGERLVWDGQTPLKDSQEWIAQGQNILTPHAVATLSSQLTQLMQSSAEPNPWWKALADAVSSWDVLSQTLDGVDDMLSGCATALILPPPGLGTALTQGPGPGVATPPLGALVGDQWRTCPLPVTQNPATALREGLARLETFAVVDAFGQRRSLQGQTLHPTPALTPDDLVAAEKCFTGTDVDLVQIFQLPPRLLHATRLELTLLSASPADKGAALAQASHPDPICGWLLPNHLDQGIAVYDREGAWCCEITPWGLTPPTLPAGMNPTLAQVVQALQAQRQELDAVLQAIDESAWLFDPLGSRQSVGLATLVGRPLVVVQADLALRSRGVRETTEQPQIQCRLGDPALRDEGLLAYFLGGETDSLYCVRPPVGAGGSFVQDQGQGVTLTLDAPAQRVTLILDPRGTLHSSTGVLPVLRTALPDHSTAARGDRLSLRFRTGPLLSAPDRVAVPPPASVRGFWSFTQEGPNPPPELVLTSRALLFPAEPSCLHDGWLELNP